MKDVAGHKRLEGAPGRSEHLLQLVIDLWIAKIAAGVSDGTEPASRRLLR